MPDGQLHGRATFHWPLQFPEVFARGGFDAFVGNPPFMGGQLITAALGKKYGTTLCQQLLDGQTGSADLCSYFFLRASSLLREGGQAGLLATNTIAEGETRQVGLEQIALHGATIRSAVTSMRWPGTASLAVSIVWLHRGRWTGNMVLDGVPVSAISSSLSHAVSAVKQPYQLLANKKKAFKGASIQGVGFLLPPRAATEMIANHPEYAKMLFPHLGGSDVTNTRRLRLPSRWAINFFDWSLEKASQFPICLDIVRAKVKPERDKVAGRNAIGNRRAELWWRYDAQARDLYLTIQNIRHVWVLAQTSKYAVLAKQATDINYNHKVVVFASESSAVFAVLSSMFHLIWTWYYGGSLKTDIWTLSPTCLKPFHCRQVCGQSRPLSAQIRRRVQ